jgi:hypothetical protein
MAAVVVEGEEEGEVEVVVVILHPLPQYNKIMILLKNCDSEVT